MRRPLHALLAVMLTLGLGSAPQPLGKSQRVPIDAGKSTYFLLHAPAKHKASLQVISDKPGDVDLFVLGPDGAIIASDVTVGKDCKLQFTKDQPTTCVVKIANLGPGANTCTFKHNLAEAPPLAPGDIEIPAGKKVHFFRKYRDAGIGHLHAEGAIASIYKLDNVKIASGPNVYWRLDPPALYRVTLANPGKEKASVKLRDGDFHWMLHPTKESPAFDLEQDAKKTLTYEFNADKLAIIMVGGEKETDVDLMVYDKEGKEVASDTTIGKDCFVAWMPAKTAVYRVVVANHGTGPNRCVVKHNGEAR